MYRLAALYEERARSDDDPNSDLAITLKPAISLYKRVIREFPKYQELAGIYYFLGHALNDSRRVDEAEQVWRSLVCRNHYKYPVATDPKDADIDKVEPMPQDHDAAYWKTWRNKFPTPESLKKVKGGALEEVSFDDPFPQDCEMIPQPSVLPGQEPKYVAEVWWRMGDWEFDQLDLGGGVLDNEPFAVWDYNRAASDYTHAMQYKKPPLFGVALYKYAWTLFKQQRYEAAVREFVHLLNYTDEQQKLTGDPGADFRQEAFTYIAGSLDNFDFAGPGPDEPYVARPDVLDTARSPAEAGGQAAHRDRPRAEPGSSSTQDKPWTIEIYKAGSRRSSSCTINQYKNALAVYQMILDRWPMDPSAPETQNAVAEVYDLLVRGTKVGPERSAYERKVLEARTALAKYIGDTPWVDANKDNPGALQRAEELVRTGLKGAAITHTRNGQAAVDQVGQTNDPKEQLRLANYALQEYKLAALGWLGYIKQDENAPDAYKSRYFYADALHNQVRLEVKLHNYDPRQFPEPSSQDIASAIAAAVAVRDSEEDDQFIDNAGLFVVDLADVDRDLAYQRWRDTSGTQGIEERKGPKLEGPEGQKKVVVDEIPGVVQKSMEARDEFVQRVPAERDKQHLATLYGRYVADSYFAYGHFKEAAARYQALYDQYCHKDPAGYEGWKGLMAIATQSNDSARSDRAGHEGPGSGQARCAIERAVISDAARQAQGHAIRRPVIINARFQDANDAYEAAKAALPGRRRTPSGARREKLYEDALRAASSQGRVGRGHPGRPSVTSRSASSTRRSSSISSSSPTTAARRSSIACRTAAPTPRARRRSGRIRPSTRSASSTWRWRTTRCRPRTTASSRTSARPSPSEPSRPTRGSTTPSAPTRRASGWCSIRTWATART